MEVARRRGRRRK